MKTNLLVFACLLITSALTGQSPKKALYEHFTQASCPPCASVNPVLHPILDRNKDKVVQITHQVSWPGYDPMNEDNPSEVANRVSYYGTNAVPSGFLEGKKVQLTPSISVTDDLLQQAAEVASNYDLEINPKLNTGINELDVEVKVKLTDAMVGRPVLRVVVMEKVIRFTKAPGTNGEKEFFHVVKKFLPGTAGTVIADLTVKGDSRVFNFNYKFNNLYDFKNLEVAAFIQNDLTKEALQAANSEVTFPQTQGLDLVLRSGTPSNVPDVKTMCATKTFPTVNFMNIGNTPITKILFRYSCNNGPSAEYIWTGSIPYLSEKTIALGELEIPFIRKSGNSIQVEAVEINGSSDIDPANNKLEIAFDAPPATTLNSRIEIKPLSKPDLISFELTDDAGKVLLKDGPFANNTLKSYPLTLDKDRCYKLSVNNRHVSVNGTARLFDENNTLLFNTSLASQKIFTNDFTTYELVTKSSNVSVEINELEINPNPAGEDFNLSWHSERIQDAQINIINMQGELIRNYKIKMASGKNSLSINGSEILAGVYFVRINTKNKVVFKKLILQQ
ncbi:MAG: T9SS type A sorting domain-containing protein [Saprospiraceae bacterium]|nr:T9SS type A sorting domain-containing protein [Candidatus Vicinibacter affinis]